LSKCSEGNKLLHVEENGQMSMCGKLIRARSSQCKQAILICAFTMGLALFCQSTAAQSTRRDVAGIVTDQHREPLRGAVVQIDDEETKVVFSYITGRGGQFSFRRLNGADDYHIWATRKGHRSKATHLSPFDNHQSKAVTLIVKFQ
jgi:hypothetical protein